MTSIEIMAVMAIVGLVTSLAVPPAISAVHANTRNQASEALVSLIGEAQLLARSSIPPAIDPRSPMAVTPHYGICLRPAPGGGFEVAMLYGNQASDLVPATPDFASRQQLPANVGIEIDTGTGPRPLNQALCWFFAYDSGAPIASPSATQPISIGRAAQTRRWLSNTTLVQDPSPVTRLIRIHGGVGYSDIAIDATGVVLISDGD
ncbi:MAG: type II secretion system protein [Planctomycetota bacterium]|nr:type II secretion system protein [Planctomycetota bacterium]